MSFVAQNVLFEIVLSSSISDIHLDLVERILKGLNL